MELQTPCCVEPGIVEAVQKAAEPEQPKPVRWMQKYEDPHTGELLFRPCTFEETSFGEFVRNRSWGGQMFVDPTQAKNIIEGDRNLFGDIQKLLKDAGTRIAQGFPIPGPDLDDKSWTAAVHKYSLALEFIEDEVKKMKQFPHLQPKTKPAP